MATVRLSDITVGNIVKINENGVPAEFYVACHDYESGLNGAGRTLLLRRYIYDVRRWDDSSGLYSETSEIDAWLNGDYKALLDANVQAAIGSTTFRYLTGNTATEATLSRAVFLLSTAELNKPYWNTSRNEGTAVPVADAIRKAYYNGSTKAYWTRTIYTGYANTACYINAAGGLTYEGYVTSIVGSRPAFTLPAAQLVDADTNELVFVEAPASVTVPASGGSSITVRVKATDAVGNESGYTTGASASVGYNVAPTISGEDGDLGAVTAAPAYAYTVTDPDAGQTITVTEKVTTADGKTHTLRTYEATSGQQQAVVWNCHCWLCCLPGTNTLTITATDGVETVNRRLTFTRPTECISFARAVASDAMASKVLLSIYPTPVMLPGDCTIEAQVTNNPFDDTPVWEDASTRLNRVVHTFANSTCANGYGVGYRLCIRKGASGAEVSADTVVLRFA